MNCKRCNSNRVVEYKPNPLIKIGFVLSGVYFLTWLNIIGLIVGIGLIGCAFTRRKYLKCEECGEVW